MFDTIEEITSYGAAWGTYGKDGKYKPLIKIIPLVWCDTVHLEAILRTQKPAKLYVDIITRILEIRGETDPNKEKIREKKCKKKRDRLPQISYNETQLKENIDLQLLSTTEDKNLPLLINHKWRSRLGKRLFKEKIARVKKV